MGPHVAAGANPHSLKGGLMITWILCIFLLSLASGASAFPRAVFAHYHTTNMWYVDSQSGANIYRDDVRSAMELGIGFAVNVPTAALATSQLTGLSTAATALGATNFRFFLSANMSGAPMPAADIISIIQTWDSSPYYYKINGKPVLSTWFGDDQTNTWWQTNVLTPLATSGHAVTFIPYFDRTSPLSDNPTFANWTSLINEYPSIDGLYNFFIYKGGPFEVADTTEFGTFTWSMMDGEEALAAALHAQGKVFMAPYMPYYWATCHSSRQYLEYQGGKGLANQWLSIINEQAPELIEITTWNDYTESTHIQPTRVLFNESTIPTTPHLGFYELLKYYIAWYKAGIQPTITKDAVFYFYRTQSKNVTASNDGAACGIARPSTANGQLWGNIQDEIYVTTVLTAPAEIRVISNGVTTTVSSIPAGVTTTDFTFTAGTQKVELWRGGSKIGEQNGVNVASAPTVYNYHVYSNYFVVGGDDGDTWVTTDRWNTGYVADWFTVPEVVPSILLRLVR
jgi:glucan endo-1,3-alpha-glucosidase